MTTVEASEPSRWESMRYVAPVPVAGVSIVPTYFLFERASRLRTEAVISQSLSLIESVKAGVKAVPNVALMMGSQLILQRWLERQVTNVLHKDVNQSLGTRLVLSGFVGLATAPIEYAFTQRTMGNANPWKSVKTMTRWQAMQYGMRNGASVFGLTSGSWLAQKFQSQTPKSDITELALGYLAIFTSGALGGMLGHVPNCSIIRDALIAKGMPLPKIAWWRGMGWRGASVGGFAITYETVNRLSGQKV